MSKDSGIVEIHGKSYQTVSLRVRNFREAHPDYRLMTEIVSRDEDCVVMRAMIANSAGEVLATGHSEEYRQSSPINKTSALENCETSAIGRALAALGMGGTEFASADEVARAVSGQKGAVKSVAREAWDELDEETQKWLGTIEDGVRMILETKGGVEAMKTLEEQGLEADHKVAIWSRFNSKERAAMEPHKRAKKVA